MISAYMPQPSGGSSYLPYPTQATQPSNFPPYPTGNSFGGFPGYPPAQGGGYPPYNMPASSYQPMGGYNANYVSSIIFGKTSELELYVSLQPPGNAGNSGTITEEHIKASLISAVEDKLRRRIEERVNQCQAEVQTLKRTKQELTEGQTKIQQIISKLEREEQELQKNISVLKDKEQELEKSLESLEKVDGIDVDEAVITTAPLYRQ
jgi:ESCRT-I complex subunit TSG101